MAKVRRSENNINASSMADIAFLLLIFFLVTTTILEDKGIAVRLPVWTDDPIIAHPIKNRNVLIVKINANDNLMVEGEEIPLTALKEKAMAFIVNPNLEEDLAESPRKAIISLQNDRGTKYESYISVYNELKAAYNELWTELSQRQFGRPYSDEMPTEMKKKIRSEIPFILSEAEPTNHSNTL